MLRLAPRILLCEPGEARPTGDDLVLEVLPPTGKAFVFGDGSHPTTRLCAAAVQTLCRARPPRSVLDVGTGTGVLARIARALGALRVVGTDIDAHALATAAAHAALDGHPVPLELDDRAPDAWNERFELIVANILEAPLIELAPALVRALAPGGTLLLSGFTAPQAPRLRVAFEGLGLASSGTARAQDWTLLAFRAPAGFSPSRD